MPDAAVLHLLHVGSVDGERVSGTVSLVMDGAARIIVDPGMVPSRAAILDALARHRIGPEEVTHVLLTHHHPDHTINVGLFPNADVIDGWAVYRDDRWIDHAGEGFRPTPHVRLMLTPGHTPEDATWLIETDAGVVACTHAWWLSDRTPEVDPLASDQAQLAASRRRILAEASVVVPGHGAPFDVDGSGA